MSYFVQLGWGRVARAIYDLLYCAFCKKDVDARHEAGHDG